MPALTPEQLEARLAALEAGPCLNRTRSAAFVHLADERAAGSLASRADDYRRRAQQCLEMARTFGDRDARVILSHMAQAWLRLADNCQDAKKVRPAMQQQQQIQPRD